MADSFQVLKNKYEMALASIRELEQERNAALNQVEELQKSRAQIDKSTKYLCETIFKKEKEGENEKAWFKLSLSEMIDKAQISLENYFPTVKKECTEMLYINKDRTKKIKELNAEIEKNEKLYKEQLKEQRDYKDQVIEKLKNKLKSGKMDDEGIEDVIGSVKKPKMADIDTSDIEFEEENEDNLGEAVEESAPVFNRTKLDENAGPRGIGAVNSNKTKNVTKDVIGKMSKEKEKELGIIAKTLKDGVRQTIYVMGKSGQCDGESIKRAGNKLYPDDPIESRIHTSLYILVNKDKWHELWPDYIVEKIACPTPRAPKYCIYHLTSLGEDLYRFLFNEDPAEPEMHAILSHHGTLEHGYGIKVTAEAMRESSYIEKMQAEVIYMTRRKDHTIKLEDGKEYIPDIIVSYKNKDGKECKDYFEYETGKCKGTDFFAKCYKIASFSRYINIIVPTADAKKIILKELEDWKENVLKKEYSFKFPRIEGRVMTWKELNDQKSAEHLHKLKWDQVTISKPTADKKKR